jgi:hypothetical protein
MITTRQRDALAHRSFQLHRDQLQEQFKNVLSAPHDHAIKSFHALLAGMVDSQDTGLHGHWGFGASVGFGKSTGLAMFIKGAASLNFLGTPGQEWEHHNRHLSALVTAMRIDSLYELERLMTTPTGTNQFFVPAHRIAVIHSDTTGAYRKSDDGKDAPICLVAHNKLKHVSKHPTDSHEDSFLFYRGSQRDICLIDEAFNDAEATYVDQGFLSGAMRNLIYNASHHRDTTAFKPLLAIMEPLAFAIEAENERQLSLGELAYAEGMLQSPSMTKAELNECLTLVKRLHMTRDDKAIVTTFLKMLPSAIRLIRGKQSGIISVVNTMPPCITNRIELNASFEIDQLSTLDTTVKNADTTFPMLQDLKTIHHLTGLADIVDYSGLTITHLHRGGGKSTIAEHLEDIRKMTPGTLEVIQFFIDAITSTPADEGVLVVTFKDDGPEYVKTLQKVFKRAGIDLDATVRDCDGVEHPRIAFTTYGAHLSTNAYRYCSTAVLAGVMQRHKAQVAGEMCGARHSVAAAVAFPEVEQVYQAISAATAQQTIGRIRLRIIENGRAMPCRVFICHRDSPEGYFKKRLLMAFPSARWIDQASENRKKKSQTYQVSVAISAILKTDYTGQAFLFKDLKEKIRPDTQESAYSARSLSDHEKKESDTHKNSHSARPLSKQVWNDAIRLFLKDNPEWRRQGHALIRHVDQLGFLEEKIGG